MRARYKGRLNICKVLAAVLQLNPGWLILFHLLERELLGDKWRRVFDKTYVPFLSVTHVQQ